MLFIFGFSHSTRPLGIAAATCPHCGNHAAQRIERSRRRLSVFFIPLVPLGSTYVMTCSVCGTPSEISRDQAQRILAAG